MGFEVSIYIAPLPKALVEQLNVLLKTEPFNVLLRTWS